MQLRFSNPSAFKIAGSNFNQSISAILTGITLAGAFSTIIFNSKIASKQVNNAFQAINNMLERSLLYEGAKQVVATLKDWGIAIFSAKDDFRIWLNNYLNANGFKSGIVELYNKLYEWSLIVYTWFKDRFLEFISNIPEMVKNWKKLRLSLFKWGTFLGGGGGSALWAMFGSGANWDKLGALMGHPDFEEMMNDFNQLIQDNEESFKEMGSEGIQDIIQKYLDNPEEAKQAAKDLIKEQKEKNAENEKKPESEQEIKEELSAESIKDKFNPKKAGNPEDIGAVLNSMVSKGLDNMLKGGFFSFDNPSSLETKAKEGMNEYIKAIKEDLEKSKAKESKENPKKEFLDIIGESADEFVKYLAEAAKRAYIKSNNTKIDDLKQRFIDELTSPCSEGSEECNAEGLVKALTK